MTSIMAPTLRELARDINREHGLVETHVANAMQHAITCGQILHDAKEKAGHGNWLVWLAENFNASVDTAENYMRLASNSERVRNLSMREGLRVLAPPKPREDKPAPPDPSSLGGRLLTAVDTPAPRPEPIVDAEVVEEPPPALDQTEHTRWRKVQERSSTITASLAEASQTHLSPGSVANLLDDAAREARFLTNELQQLAAAFRKQAA